MFQFIQHNNKIFLSGVIICAVVAVGVLGYATIFNYKQQLPQDNKIGVPQETPENSVAPNPPSGAGFEELYQDGTVILEKPLEDKSILMIVAFKGFEDKEYFTVKQYFLAAGIKNVMTASDEAGVAIGVNGGEAQVNLPLKQVNIADFDAVILVGGSGMGQHLDIPDSYRIIQSAVLGGKLVAAISSSPAVLAKAGILSGIQATSDVSEKATLEANGAVFQNKSVVQSGAIITANAVSAVDEFSLQIIDYLMQ